MLTPAELTELLTNFPGPHSLGLIGERDFTTVALSAYEPKIINELESHGAATGSFLYVSKLIEEAMP